jgi:hypothetical protein
VAPYLDSYQIQNTQIQRAAQQDGIVLDTLSDNSIFSKQNAKDTIDSIQNEFEKIAKEQHKKSKDWLSYQPEVNLSDQGIENYKALSENYNGSYHSINKELESLPQSSLSEAISRLIDTAVLDSAVDQALIFNLIKPHLENILEDDICHVTKSLINYTWMANGSIKKDDFLLITEGLLIKMPEKYYDNMIEHIKYHGRDYIEIYQKSMTPSKSLFLGGGLNLLINSMSQNFYSSFNARG